MSGSPSDEGRGCREVLAQDSLSPLSGSRRIVLGAEEKGERGNFSEGTLRRRPLPERFIAAVCGSQVPGIPGTAFHLFSMFSGGPLAIGFKSARERIGLREDLPLGREAEEQTSSLPFWCNETSSRLFGENRIMSGIFPFFSLPGGREGAFCLRSHGLPWGGRRLSVTIERREMSDPQP